jgi:hypothetical protein
VDTWITSYRAVLTDDEAKKAIDPTQMNALLETNRVSVAGTFTQLSDLLMLRRRDILLFQRKQQNINRIVLRSAEAIRRIAEALDKLNDFCFSELPKLVQDAIATTTKPSQGPSPS